MAISTDLFVPDASLSILRADILANHILITTSCVYIVVTRSKALSNKIPRLSPYIPSNRYDTLPFDKNNHLAYRMFGQNRNTHMYEVDTKMAFDDPAFGLSLNS